MDIKITLSDPLALIAETRFNSVTSVMTIDRLVRCAPVDLTADEKKALKAMVAARNVVEGVREERATWQPAKLRPVIARNATAWGGLSNVLAAKAGLSPEIAGDKPARAQALRDALFPDGGVPQLKLDADTSYLESRERIERIDREKLAHEVSAIAGSEHLDDVRASTEALGEAIGVGSSARVTLNSTAMQDALRHASHAVGLYGRQLLAKLDENDDASVKRFVDALAPLADHKATLARGPVADDSGAPTDGATPTTPTEPAAPVTPVTSPTAG